MDRKTGGWQSRGTTCGAARRSGGAAPLRIVTVNSHQPYVHLLGGLPHSITVVDRGLAGGACPWQEGIRPLPVNCRCVDWHEAAIEASHAPFDVALAHSVTDLLALRDLSPHRILLVQRTLAGQIAHERSPLSLHAFAALVMRYLESTPAHVVYVSESKRMSWAPLEGEVQVPGVPDDAYAGYSGERPIVLRVASLLSEPGDVLGHDLQQDVVRGVPNTLLGFNPGVAGARRAASWDELRTAYRTHRLLLVTQHPQLEDGHNLAVIEAMMTGMPVVTTPHPTTPISHEWDGLIGADARQLRQHVERLLQDRDLALRLGCRARATAQEKFAFSPFLAGWDERLRGAVTRPREVIAARYPERRSQSAVSGQVAAARRPALRLVRGGGGGSAAPGPVANPALRAVRGGLVSDTARVSVGSETP